ncbi:hypothetical protein [Zavarzinella formosa]|uniref:hypothetical protein n=1 Tax=Zavarzinella formosa TaxID=360055 RepID=UPI00030A67AB|nr:hypothetical protein [Zavarzinella formosa]
MIRRRLLLTAGAIALMGSGCNILGPRPAKHDDIPPPLPSVDDRKPTAEQLISYLNRQADQLESIETRSLDIDVKSMGSSVSLDGSLVCQKPRNFKLVGRKLAMEQVLMGSNSDRFWFYIRQDPSNALFHCSYTDFEKGVDLPYPFDPEWVLEALGMAKINAGPGTTVEEDRNHYKLIEETTVRGQKVKKVTVFHKGNARDSQPQIVSKTMMDAATNKVICTAIIKEVARIPIERGAGLPPKYIICPRIITLEWPQQDTKLTLDLGKLRVNQPIKPDLFEMPPDVGAKQVDLGKFKPTGRVVPAGYR